MAAEAIYRESDPFAAVHAAMNKGFHGTPSDVGAHQSFRRTVEDTAWEAFTPAAMSDVTAEAGLREDADDALASSVSVAQSTANVALPKAGGTMTGKIILDGDPILNLHAATKQYVTNEITALIDGAPGTLDTLNEIADQLANDESAVAALTATVAGKLSASANLGDVVSPVASRSNLGLGNVDNTTDLSKPISTATQTALDGVALSITATANASIIKGPGDSARNVIQPTADVVPLTVRAGGAAANIQEWRLANNTLSASISSAGNWSAPNIYAVNVIQGSSVNANSYFSDSSGTKPYIEIGASTWTMRGRNAAQTPWTIKGFAAQTAPVFRVADSADADLMSLGASGAQALRTNVWHGTTDGVQRVYYDSAGPVYHKATSHQWWDAASNALATLTSAGQLRLPMQGSTGGLLIGGAWAADLYASAAGMLTTSGQIAASGLSVGSGGVYNTAVPTRPSLGWSSGKMTVSINTPGSEFRILAAAAQTAPVQRWATSADADLMTLTSTGQLQLPTTGTAGGVSIAGRLIYEDTARTSLRTASTFEAGGLNSFGYLSAFRETANEILMGYDGAANSPSIAFSSSWDTILKRTAAGELTMYGRGAAAQSRWIRKMVAAQASNPVEFQDSATAIVMRIGSTGAIRTAGDFGSTASGKANLTPNGTVGGWLLNTNAAGNIGLAVRGFTSQTYNLQEWQDVGGTSLASVTSLGLHRWSAANRQTTVGAAGGAAALPATPTRYLKVVDSDGTSLVVPAYLAA